MDAKQIVVWINLKQARIFRGPFERSFGALEDVFNDAPEAMDLAHGSHAFDLLASLQQELWYFNEIVGRLIEADRILVLGPDHVKERFFDYLHEELPSLAGKVIGCETMSELVDADVSRYARWYFEADRLEEAG